MVHKWALLNILIRQDLLQKSTSRTHHIWCDPKHWIRVESSSTQTFVVVFFDVTVIDIEGGQENSGTNQHKVGDYCDVCVQWKKAERHNAIKLKFMVTGKS